MGSASWSGVVPTGSSSSSLIEVCPSSSGGGAVSIGKPYASRAPGMTREASALPREARVAPPRQHRTGGVPPGPASNSDGGQRQRRDAHRTPGAGDEDGGRGSIRHGVTAFHSEGT